MAGLSHKLAAEMTGVFILTFIGAGSIVTSSWTGGQPGLVGIALAHGLALAIAVSATMNISGGHINPAVTAALFVTGRIKAATALFYVIAQCVGAIIAGLLLAYIFSRMGAGAAMTGTAAIESSKLGLPHYDSAVVPGGLAIVVEAVLTFILVFAVFGTAVDERAPRIGGFGIGLAVCIDILMGGPITGAGMNPARTLGSLVGGGSVNSAYWAQHGVYWIGPILGAILAALFYDIFILRPLKSKA